MVDMKDIIEKAKRVELPRRCNLSFPDLYPLIERASNPQTCEEKFTFVGYSGLILAIYDAYKYGFQRGRNYEKNHRKNHKK